MLCALPGSEQGTYAWLESQVYALEWQGLELHHLYCNLDFLDKPVSRQQQWDTFGTKVNGHFGACS